MLDISAAHAAAVPPELRGQRVGVAVASRPGGGVQGGAVAAGGEAEVSSVEGDHAGEGGLREGDRRAGTFLAVVRRPIAINTLQREFASSFNR